MMNATMLSIGQQRNVLCKIMINQICAQFQYRKTRRARYTEIKIHLQNHASRNDGQISIARISFAYDYYKMPLSGKPQKSIMVSIVYSI